MTLEAMERRVDFPTKQLAILLACRLVEPLAVTSIVPYIFLMVKELLPELNDAEATRYVTIIFSTYAFAQFATNILWGRISDHIGRRPVMLFGLVSVLVGTLGLGFSSSIASIFVFRVISGLLSGNVVITRTMIGDMVHGRENKARAFAWNQTAYQIGYVVGPILGGYLVQPCSQFPRVCEGDRWALLQRYPFALPNLVISVLIVLSLVTAYFFLNESLDRTAHKTSSATASEQSPLLEQAPDTKVASISTIFDAKIVHVVVSYGIMALHTICFDQIFPVFLATQHASSSLPFLLNGGLSMSSAMVANFISGSGILSIVLMITIFPKIDSLLGSLRCLTLSLLLYPITYFLLPYLVVVPGSPGWLRIIGVVAILFLKTLAAVFSFNENAVLLNVVAPSPSALGLVNGVAQTAAAGARAVGPAAMGVFIGFGDKVGSEALGWWFLSATALVGAIQGYWVVDEEEDEL